MNRYYWLPGLTAVCLLLLAHLAGSTADMQTVKLADWCTASFPTEVKLGEQIQVMLTLSGVQAPTKVDAHLHYNKTGGVYGGMYAYAPPQEVKGDGVFTFSYPIVPKEGLESVHLLIYLSTTGDWSADARQVNGPAIPLAAMTADGRDTKALLAQIFAMEYRKSWLSINAGSEKVLHEGDAWPVTIEYYLDPTEDTGSTKINFLSVGPWVDVPDGVYTKSRAHNGSGGSFSEPALPGHHLLRKQLTIPRAQEYNSLLCIGHFSNAEVGDWPWEIRAGGPAFAGNTPAYHLETDQPGNLFTYTEPVRVYAVINHADAAGIGKQLAWTISDSGGHPLAHGVTALNGARDGQRVAIDLPAMRERGVFLLETDTGTAGDARGKQQIFFARIPDVLAVTGGKATTFGMTFAGTDINPKIAEAAAKLGFTSCRLFCSLKSISPTKGDLRSAGLEQVISTFDAHGITPWICLYDLPPWLQQGKAVNQGYYPIPFNHDGWAETVRKLAERLKGKISGWEWLNEIVPGEKCVDPVAEYVNLCKIGTETARAVDPHCKCLLAGGLWPRNFRTALLTKGIGQYIDVLPVHYSDGQGVLEAREDLAVYGLEHDPVWDDESARGLSTWNVPPAQRLLPDVQCNWVLQHWPDELIAGANRLVYFGGGDDPCGNWSYLMGGMNPRPVAVTLAVLISKLAQSRPIGKFYINARGVFHLFARNGKPVLLAALAGESKTASDYYGADTESLTIPLKVGTGGITVTDYQGNESTLQASHGEVALPLTHRPVFIEGADLAALQSYLIPSIEMSPGQMPTPAATVTLLRTAPGTIELTMRNINSAAVSGTVQLAAPANWPAQSPLAFTVKAGQVVHLRVALAFAPDLPDGLYPLMLDIHYRADKLARVEQPVNVNIISPALLGNLLQNGGFETAGEPDTAATGWHGEAQRVHADAAGLGLGDYVAKFSGAAGWQSYSQTLDKLPPGRTYLYSAWVWCTDMQAGSNVYQQLQDGSTKNFYIPSVFDAGSNTGGWKMLSCHIAADPQLARLTLAPVANGKGQAMFDNLRLSVYEGSDFTAEAHKVSKPLTLDGTLANWETSCPLPLFGENQLVKLDENYQWSPADFAGVAYLAWDSKNLYLDVAVREKTHYARATGEKTCEDDSVTLAIRPGGTSTPAAHAFCYYLSSANPGGSGKATLYRPVEKSGGLTAGQLARDSSVYEINVKTVNDLTVYQVRLPFADMGGITPALGTKIGISLLLNHSDGAGRDAVMKWGDGVFPAWSPAHFGILTLVD